MTVTTTTYLFLKKIKVTINMHSEQHFKKKLENPTVVKLRHQAKYKYFNCSQEKNIIFWIYFCNFINIVENKVTKVHRGIKFETQQ